MLRRIFFVFGFSLLVSSFLISQELPPVISFVSDDYNADNQNWSVTQSWNNYIFVANNKGLLEFNGSSWHLYPSPNASIIRSVYAHQDLIYSGSFRDFGFWKRNPYGQWEYTSLVAEHNIKVGENEEFWTILSYSNWILFQSLDSIFIFNTDEGRISSVLPSEFGITKMMKVEDDIYFSKPKKGIFKIKDGQSVLVSDHTVFRENLVLNIYKSGSDLLVQTNSAGIYYLSDNPVIWGGENAAVFSSVTVYNSIQDRSGNLILGTISDGVLKIDLNGNIVYHITKRESLINNTVLSLFEDISGNIWLGLDNGINCINQNSPISIFYDRSGQLGTVYTSIVYSDVLYLGTNQGLFYRPFNSEYDSNFKLVSGSVGQVWDLFTFGGNLFVGHNDGTFIVQDKQLIQISDEPGTWCFREIPGKQNLLLQGNYKGLSIIEQINGEWVFRNKLSGFDISSRYIKFLNPTTVLISHEYKGVYKLSFREDFHEILGVEKVTSVEKGLYASLVNFKGEILYANPQGIWKYDDSFQQFFRDDFLSKLYCPDTYSSGKLISTDTGRELWVFSKGSIYHLSPGRITGNLEVAPIPIHYGVRNAMVGYENIFQLDESLYLFGNTQGYFIIDLNGLKTDRRASELKFYRITAYNHNQLSKKLLALEESVRLSARYNHLEFSFSMPEFENFFTAEYRYKLSGMMEDWSPWVAEKKLIFNNLPAGSYELKIQGRIGDNLFSNLASFSFEIDRPFFFTRGMIFLYIVTGIVLAFIIHSAYKNYYKRQRIKLQQKSLRELDFQESENKRKLMRLNNEKLQQDIESKNRELAISTMSLIKKNKVLNGIKSELSKFDGDPRQIRKVLSLINKNLKSGSDWEFFEKAFNNADRDFFKKIKEKHDSLTPDDLRLCAYLRLNLSSKEMAPLLGISPKSVEIKRYRLRKKMDLDSDVNLTEYILRI